jgi:hypothetical protein
LLPPDSRPPGGHSSRWSINARIPVRKVWSGFFLRGRDASLACLGFIVLRFDWQQIFFEPDEVVAAVLRYVELGLHRF